MVSVGPAKRFPPDANDFLDANVRSAYLLDINIATNIVVLYCTGLDLSLGLIYQSHLMLNDIIDDGLPVFVFQ